MPTSTPLSRFRFIAIAEGISFLLLMFIGMPLKYFAGLPHAVLYMGWCHGILFILYVIALVQVKSANDWTLKKTATAFIASLLPFGTFVFDKQIKNELQELNS